MPNKQRGHACVCGRPYAYQRRGTLAPQGVALKPAEWCWIQGERDCRRVEWSFCALGYAHQNRDAPGPLRARVNEHEALAKAADGSIGMTSKHRKPANRELALL
jgi:hypothetical protein